jgi:hypothetical protein
MELKCSYKDACIALPRALCLDQSDTGTIVLCDKHFGDFAVDLLGANVREEFTIMYFTEENARAMKQRAADLPGYDLGKLASTAEQAAAITAGDIRVNQVNNTRTNEIDRSRHTFSGSTPRASIASGAKSFGNDVKHDRVVNGVIVLAVLFAFGLLCLIFVLK